MTDIQKLIEARAASDPRLKAVLKKLDAGTATLRDSAYYADIYSNIAGRVFGENVLDMEAADREGVCEKLLRSNYNEINSICAQVQAVLDEPVGIHIRPQKAPFPLERVKQIARALMDPTVEDDTIKRRANTGVANVSKSFHDDYIRQNAKFRNDAGLKCYISRETDGSCCQWCSDIAGRYVYSDAPEDVYRRHDNCGCRVTFENGRERQDVWTKRTWEAPETGEGAPSPTVLSEEAGKAIEQRNLQYKGLTNDSGSDKIVSKECEIHPNKVQNFFLKPGAKHSNEFFDVGYTIDDIEKLTDDLKNCFDYSKAVDKFVSETGIEKFSIFVELGVDKKKRFRTVWQKDTPDSSPRIITAHREDG